MHNQKIKKISLKKLIGRGYKKFWDFKGRYRVCKGGRGSKKSKTTALNYIHNMMKYPESNLLVVRAVFNTHKDSTYADLCWAIHQLGVGHLWKTTTSPLQIIYEPTGQKILFRGLDNPLSITSITVEKGYLCWAWFEEAYQVKNEDDFDKVDMSIRGYVPPHLFKQITLTFNPWSDKHWLKNRFFDVQDDDILAITTNYLCNEFLDDADIKLFNWMKINKPQRYKVEGLGFWGITDGLVYDDWEEISFDYKQLIKERPHLKAVFGLDFGYTTDATGFIGILVDSKTSELFIFDEHYQTGMVNKDIAQMIKYKGYQKEKIIADCSEPKSIDEIKAEGIKRIQGALKGKDSINFGIQFIKGYKIFVHTKCRNTITELSNYSWAKDKSGKATGKPIDDFNHILDAFRYAMEQLQKNKKVTTSSKKGLPV